MPERDDNLSKTTEQEAAEMLGLIEGTEFGSTVYQAVSDYLEQDNLRSSLIILRKNASSYPEDPERSQGWESELRIKEMRMALLENEIRRKESLLGGYSNVYHQFMSIDGELYDVSKEASTKFLEDARNVVYEIREASQLPDNDISD